MTEVTLTCKLLYAINYCLSIAFLSPLSSFFLFFFWLWQTYFLTTNQISDEWSGPSSICLIGPLNFKALWDLLERKCLFWNIVQNEETQLLETQIQTHATFAVYLLDILWYYDLKGNFKILRMLDTRIILMLTTMHEKCLSCLIQDLAKYALNCTTASSEWSEKTIS